MRFSLILVDVADPRLLVAGPSGAHQSEVRDVKCRDAFRREAPTVVRRVGQRMLPAA